MDPLKPMTGLVFFALSDNLCYNDCCHIKEIDLKEGVIWEK